MTAPKTKQPPGSERARDEQRETGGPRYGGEAWQVADERGDKRFGHARNDDADPSELKPGEGENQDRGDTNSADDRAGLGMMDPQATADDRSPEQKQASESGGERAGIGRGEKPRKPASRGKKS